MADESILDAGELFDFNTNFSNIKELFEELNENQKNVLTMRYIADADTETIAQALSINTDNVRQLESRGLKN